MRYCMADSNRTKFIAPSGAGEADIKNAFQQLERILNGSNHPTFAPQILDGASGFIDPTKDVAIVTSATGGSYDLPAAILASGRIFEVKDGFGTASADPITLNSADLIDGSATYQILTDNGHARVYSDGTTYRVL